MLPLWPELVPSNSLNRDDALIVVGYGDGPAGACLAIPAPQLDHTPLVEVWRSSSLVTRSRIGPLSLAWNGVVMTGHLTSSGPATDIVTASLYEQIVDAARSAGYPHLLRVWNHVGAINAMEGEMERYKRFSSGRHEALTGRGYDRQQFPAASAVGMRREGVVVYFIASRTAGLQVENPRQVAAYDYPPVHGPRSPSFARATVAQWDEGTMIFISGTSSVVGHETRHQGDVEAQLDETFENLRVIVSQAAERVGRTASLSDLTVAKTYIRNAAHYERIAGQVRAELPSTQHLFIESDICRSDLLLEIEGIVTI